MSKSALQEQNDHGLNKETTHLVHNIVKLGITRWPYFLLPSKDQDSFYPRIFDELQPRSMNVDPNLF